MKALVLAVLLCAACGTVTADPHDAGGAGGQLATGGAGGQVAAAGGQGGHVAAGGAGGAAGAPSSSTGGAGGAPVPTCPRISSCSFFASSSCCEGCAIFGDGGVTVGYITATCRTTAAENSIFSSPGPDYCVAKASACP